MAIREHMNVDVIAIRVAAGAGCILGILGRRTMLQSKRVSLILLDRHIQRSEVHARDPPKNELIPPGSTVDDKERESLCTRSKEGLNIHFSHPDPDLAGLTRRTMVIKTLTHVLYGLLHTEKALRSERSHKNDGQGGPTQQDIFVGMYLDEQGWALKSLVLICCFIFLSMLLSMLPIFIHASSAILGRTGFR